MSRFLIGLAVLVLVYLLVLASAAPWDVAFGVLLGTGLLVATRTFILGERPAPIPNLPRRLLALVPFAVATLADILRGTWQVALVVLHLRPLRHPGIVVVPFGERTPRGVAVTTLVSTLSPGSFLVDIDETERVMLFHVLEASDPDAVRAEFQEFYRRYQRHVIP
jgi:multisubunit Na+/H+ antiporter MnhE subunit